MVRHTSWTLAVFVRFGLILLRGSAMQKMKVGTERSPWTPACWNSWGSIESFFYGKTLLMLSSLPVRSVAPRVESIAFPGRTTTEMQRRIDLVNDYQVQKGLV